MLFQRCGELDSTPAFTIRKKLKKLQVHDSPIKSWKLQWENIKVKSGMSEALSGRNKTQEFAYLRQKILNGA